MTPPTSPAATRRRASVLGEKAERTRTRRGAARDLDELHNRLWAEARRSVVLVLQGMDAAGKDGTIRRVLTGLNPQGCSVVELQGPDRGRPRPRLPVAGARRHSRRGGILGVFNRSHYEDVVAARMIGAVDDEQCQPRYRHIREFERMLSDEGTTMVKVFLHISKDEQRARLQARIDDPEKNWKFRRSDLDGPGALGRVPGALRGGDHRDVHRWAPWYVVPADHKWVRDVAVADAAGRRVRDASTRRSPPPEPGLEGLIVE